MTKSSLSQQLREALTIVKDYRHKFHVRMENELAIINILPAFLTEHEALQRKADAGTDIVASMENARPWCDEVMAEYITRNLAAYRESTKPSDV